MNIDEKVIECCDVNKAETRKFQIRDEVEPPARPELVIVMVSRAEHSAVVVTVKPVRLADH